MADSPGNFGAVSLISNANANTPEGLCVLQQGHLTDVQEQLSPSLLQSTSCTCMTAEQCVRQNRVCLSGVITLETMVKTGSRVYKSPELQLLLVLQACMHFHL